MSKSNIFFVVLLILIIGASSNIEGAETVTFWDITQPAGSFADVGIIKVVEEFEKQNPDLKVNLVRFPQKDFYNKVIVSFTAGSAPDVVRIQPFYNMIAAAKSGWLEPLDEKVKNSDYLQPENWYQLDAYKWDGKLWSVPNEINIRRIGYNKHVYNELGLTPPKTWDDLLINLKKSTIDVNGDNKPDRFGWGSVLYENSWAVFQFGNILAMNNAYIVNPDLETSGVSEEPFREAFKFYTRINRDYGIPGTISLDQDQLAAAFVAGKISTFSMGSWWDAILSEYGFEYKRDYDSIVNPSGPQRLKGGIPATAAVGDAWAWALPSNAKNKEGGWRLLEFLARPESRVIYNHGAPNCPREKELGGDRWSSPWWQDYISSLSAGPVLPPVQPFPKLQESYKPITDAICKSIINGSSESEDEIIDELDRSIKELLK